ncbi:FecR family protein [Psychroserpens sp.]|jgi:transmembrane sensor|uniref:FecR family protein n=1 Tax=Psychroserpens sp. TaxID=2020870 RepID=UPI0039E500B8
MNSKAYNKIEDFVNDPSFINWVNKSQLTDVKFWEHWMYQNPDRNQMVLDAKSIVLGISFNKIQLSEDKVNDAWATFEQDIKKSPKKDSYQIPFYKNRKLQSIAATLLLFVAISVVYFNNKSTTIIHKAAFGEVADISLPDGTRVKLNSNSTLSYEDSNVRDIFLEGEAYFNVEKKPTTKAKFIVRTNDLNIKVFGTAFNVNNRKSKTKVFLEEGNISLTLKNGTEKKMTPGDLLSYSYDNNVIIEETKLIRSELQISWKNGSLIFDRSTLESAMQDIEDTYGFEVIFKEDSTKKTLITGALPTQNLEICIKTIEKSANVSIVKENNKLYIHKN